MGDVTDYQFAYFNNIIYNEQDPDGPVSDFDVFSESGRLESGLAATTYIREDQDGKGAVVLTFLGTDTSKGTKLVKGQMKTNFQLSQDPDEDMQIVKDAVGYVRDTITDLKKQKSDVDWTFYTTGHSMGGFLATAVAVVLDPEITKVVTFDSPGLPKFWRETAQKMHDDSYWREHILDYLTFPNPINTTLPHIGHLVRLELHTHGAATPAHVIRCILGTALRAAVWGSALNWGLALAGKSRSFWATKAVAVSVRTSKKLFTSRFNLRKTFREAKAASKEDSEKLDAVSNGKSGKSSEKDKKALGPILSRLPPSLRAAAITTSWAFTTALISSVSYVSTRTSGAINDTQQEHMIVSILSGFDEESGDALQPVEVLQWPYHELLVREGFTKAHSRRVAVEGLLPMQPAAYGVHNLLRRKQLLLARAHSLPGYKEA
ncbi:hypothetical protein COCSUDRAFT_60661 [Coccomyxa subellipsoidea C-169]|uniref:Fungal lipase-like domain-containing protein n=1 Tax=Coccomyxa subellipsoidea (strain C-169) TaxID=574566 RepID=I0Z4T0_COCSC|nr:hypothetical protein COCSUDRAFT_60661 [Coccomyxa subellipsoidea C-169]EIE25649.1 hypothetical protein COCSUDRAFT_60661 [Coccomyxa subellipsoidea C-169]|eukprot:XP_005650193.1 hypothetical protein COCSUDRAFT_60661 [Coccomyxa subellipsoidea C-169]